MNDQPLPPLRMWPGALARSGDRRDAARVRWLAWLLAAVIGLGGTPVVALAQGEDLAEESLGDMTELPAELPTEPPDTTTQEAATLLDTVKDGGIVGLLILGLSVGSVGFIVEHFLTIRKSVIMPEHVVTELDELVEQGHFDQAIEACQAPENESLFATVVLAGLERYKGSEFGFAEYKAAVEEAGEDQTGQLYRKTEVLGVIGSVAPMLGLMGTVLGMIRAFNTIAAEGGFAKPDLLAGSIGQALVTTLMGLIVAIPTMIFFSYFRNRIDSLLAEAGKRVEQVLMPLGRRKN